MDTRACNYLPTFEQKSPLHAEKNMFIKGILLTERLWSLLFPLRKLVYVWPFMTITKVTRDLWAMTCDFQQCGILTSVDSDEPVSLVTSNDAQAVA